MKKVMLIPLWILTLNFIAAAGELSNFLYRIDPSTIILVSIFIISFAIIHLALTKSFKENRQVGTIIALFIAILITYGLNRSSINFDRWFDWFTNLDGTTILFFLIGAGILAWIIIEERNKSKKK